RKRLGTHSQCPRRRNDRSARAEDNDRRNPGFAGRTQTSPGISHRHDVTMSRHRPCFHLHCSTMKRAGEMCGDQGRWGAS
ncbi:MAG: hypothetical protein ACO250_06800, partial [Burkholderiaceae bacterium]